MPTWITHVADTQTFNIAPTDNSLAGTYTLKITATDDDSDGTGSTNTVTSTFELIVSALDTSEYPFWFYNLKSQYFVNVG
jgi:hypothetical protein